MLSGHSDRVNSIKWIKKYDLVISGADDGRIVIWNYKN